MSGDPSLGYSLEAAACRPGPRQGYPALAVAEVGRLGVLRSLLGPEAVVGRHTVGPEAVLLVLLVVPVRSSQRTSSMQHVNTSLLCIVSDELLSKTREMVTRRVTNILAVRLLSVLLWRLAVLGLW